MPAYAGYYFKGSFWCFASKNEFAWVKSAWDEALPLLEAGLRTTERAKWSAACTNLIARWFGRGEDKVMSVARAFQCMLEARRDPAQCIGICYVGPNASVNSGFMPYLEFLKVNLPDQVLADADEHGWASHHNLPWKNMGLCNKFFSKTRIGVADLADLTSYEVSASRGGAVVHEYAHLILKANDETLDPQVPGNRYDNIFDDMIKTSDQMAKDPGRTAQQQGAAKVAHDLLMKNQTARAKVKAYAPLVCRGVARRHSERALTNADNYRLFSETRSITNPGNLAPRAFSPEKRGRRAERHAPQSAKVPSGRYRPVAGCRLMTMVCGSVQLPGVGVAMHVFGTERSLSSEPQPRAAD